MVRIEEDWRLVLNQPDENRDAPQFHTVMSPYGNVDSLYLQVTWNYWEYDDFESGGLQLQAWNGDQTLFYRGLLEGQQLSTDAEVITWTQTLQTNGEVLSLWITNGQSQTWGQFGGDHMRLHGELHVSNLNGYSPDVSVANSWVTYGANRVTSLALVEVRYYGHDDDLLYRDTTQRVICRSAGD